MAWLPLNEWFWSAALSVVPVVLLAALANGWLMRRPASRHALWLCVMVWFAASPVVMLMSPGASAAWAQVWRAGGVSKPAASRGERAIIRPVELESREPAEGVEAARARLVEAGGVRADTSEPRTLTGRSAGGARVAGGASRPGAATDDDEAKGVPAGAGAATVSARHAEPGVQGGRRGVAAKRSAGSAGGRSRAGVRDVPSDFAAASRHEPAAVGVVATGDAGGPASKRAEPGRRWTARLAGALAPAAAVLMGIRDAVLALPPLPGGVWAGGTAALAVGLAIRAAVFRVRLGRARRAPPRFQRAVRRLASSMGLRDAPEAWVIDAAISPMVWCGRRPRLLIPSGLWRWLDAVGREAVVCHELAHLRRWDHWVRWLALCVGAGFWWHPLAWWVRGRLDEEAELACDAWVTWLLPHGRRSYAQALLKSRMFMQADSGGAPAVGIGVFSPRTRRFARRLTMVMTQESRPRLSAAGAVLAAVAVTIGWVSAPVWACPEKDRAGKTTARDEKAGGPTRAATAAAASPTTPAACAALSPAGGPTTPAPPAAVVYWNMGQAMPADAVTYWSAAADVAAPVTAAAPNGGATSYETFVAGGRNVPVAAPRGVVTATSSGGEDELRATLARLEAELAQLRARLDGQPAAAADPVRALTFGRQGQLERSLPYLLAQRVESPPADEVKAEMPSQEREQAKVAVGDLIVKQYAVPAGKLEALLALMVREDVPVRVRQAGNRIEVHATARQHEVFRNFVDILTPEETSRSFRLKGGKLEALWELMKRDDVPVLVEQIGGGIRAQGTPTVLRAFADFVEMIGGEAERAARSSPAAGADETAQAELYAAKAARAGRTAPLMTARLAVPRTAPPATSWFEALASQRGALQQQMEALRAQSEKLMREAEKLQREAEKLELKAEKLRERSDAAREKAAESSSETEREQAEARAAAGDAEAAALEARVQDLQAKAEAIEAQAEALEAESGQLEATAEALEVTMEGVDADWTAAEPGGACTEAATVEPSRPAVPAPVARP